MSENAAAPQTPAGTTRRQLMSILAPHRWRLLVIAAVIVLGAGLDILPALILKHVIDQQLIPGTVDGLWLSAALYLAAIGGTQLLGFLSSYLTARTAQHALHALRVRLFSHLQRLPLSYYDRTPLGDTISRCTADVETIDTLFSSGVSSLVSDLVKLATVTIAMVTLSPRLVLMSAVVVLPLAWISNSFRKRIRAAERRSRVLMGQVNTHLQETLGGVEVIRAFGREPAFGLRFRRILSEALHASNETARYSTVYSPVMQCLMAALIATLLWSGVQPEFSTLHISLGTLTAFVLLFKKFFDPITALGEEWQTVQSALSGAERIFQVLELPAEERSGTAAPVRLQDSGIEVSRMTFGYLEQRPVLREVSFEIRPGEHVAMVGRTGAGKSSILGLLSGLYAPWEGGVRIAGVDPRQVGDDRRRALVGMVPQQVQLFTGTIRENLTLGDASVPHEAVERAARIAGLDAFIRALRQGYETRISSGQGGGVQFSEGQRQLLSLARALVWDPGILLLDEATSAIDSASEAAFRAALEQETRTLRHAVLTVAHRLSTARQADRVIVMEGGRVAEIGTPDELVRRGGRFASLLELEAAGWDWHADGRAKTEALSGPQVPALEEEAEDAP
jgi:ATP-binding cassette, subfamily B, multidrug efflux pump